MMKYWLWIQCALGAAARINDIIAYFSTPQELYAAGRREWILSGILTSVMADKLEKTDIDAGDKIIEICDKNGWTIVTPASKYYPLNLRLIQNSPAALYVLGDPQILSSELTLAFVGTRRASRYGLEISYKFAYETASAGAVIVSGGALGIDSSSHRGAIDARGRTIAFLGNGLGYNYLPENEELRREIAANGAVISEFQPFTAPSRHTFPIRNRLISGLSVGTVVIEAGEKSGSLITANYAMQQGKDVFAIPGDAINSNYTGANKLIKGGAKAVFCSQDILEEYYYTHTLKPIAEKAITVPQNLKSKPPAAKKEKNNHKTTKKHNNHNDEQQSILDAENEATKPSFIKRDLEGNFSENARTVYACLDDKPQQADDISDKLKLEITAVLAALTELEIYSYASQIEGKRFTAI